MLGVDNIVKNQKTRSKIIFFNTEKKTFHEIFHVIIHMNDKQKVCTKLFVHCCKVLR